MIELPKSDRDQLSEQATSSRSPLRSRVAGIALGVLLLWSLVAMALRVRDVAHRPGSTRLGPALLWRSGTMQVKQWQEFFEAVGARVPEGSEILVDAASVDPADEFFLTMWCAYALPHHTIVRRQNLLDPSKLPAYRITTNGESSLMALTGLDRDRGPERVLLEGTGRLTLDTSLLEPGR